MVLAHQCHHGVYVLVSGIRMETRARECTEIYVVGVADIGGISQELNIWAKSCM